MDSHNEIVEFDETEKEVLNYLNKNRAKPPRRTIRRQTENVNREEQVSIDEYENKNEKTEDLKTNNILEKVKKIGNNAMPVSLDDLNNALTRLKPNNKTVYETSSNTDKNKSNEIKNQLLFKLKDETSIKNPTRNSEINLEDPIRKNSNSKIVQEKNNEIDQTKNFKFRNQKSLGEKVYDKNEEIRPHSREKIDNVMQINDFQGNRSKINLLKLSSKIVPENINTEPSIVLPSQISAEAKKKTIPLSSNSDNSKFETSSNNEELIHTSAIAKSENKQVKIHFFILFLI